MGIPIPVAIIFLAGLYYLFLLFLDGRDFITNKATILLFFIIISFILWTLFINIIFNSDPSYLLSQLIYSLVFLILFLILKKEDMPAAISGLYLSSIILFLYGLYGFITWNTGDIKQHLFGYFGVTYLNSTRNGDMVYIFPGYIISLINIYENKPKYIKLFNVFAFIIILIAILANQSRSAFIVVFALLIFTVIKFGSKSSSRMFAYLKLASVLVALILILLIVSLYVDPFFTDIVVYRISSILSLSSDSNVSYNSNSDRLDIISKSFLIFIENIFGVGITGMDLLTQGELFHSENAYLSILVYYGIPGCLLFILLIILIWKRLKFILTRDINKYVKINVLLFLMLIIYCAFNMMIDLLPFWMILGLVAVDLEK
jgi:hypothetical protein